DLWIRHSGTIHPRFLAHRHRSAQTGSWPRRAEIQLTLQPQPRSAADENRFVQHDFPCLDLFTRVVALVHTSSSLPHTNDIGTPRIVPFTAFARPLNVVGVV